MTISSRSDSSPHMCMAIHRVRLSVLGRWKSKGWTQKRETASQINGADAHQYKRHLVPAHDRQICLEMFSGTGIGPMLNRARSAWPARGKTYIHQTKVPGWPSASLWLYRAPLLPTSSNVLCSYTPSHMPERNGMLGNITTALWSGLQ